MDESYVSSLLTPLLTPSNVDPDIIEYLSSMLADLPISELQSKSEVNETVQPFLESSDVDSSTITSVVLAIVNAAGGDTTKEANEDENMQQKNELRKLHSGVVMGEQPNLSAADEEGEIHVSPFLH